MNRGKEYLSPEDLAKLIGTDSMSVAYKHHKNIRDSLVRCRNNSLGDCAESCNCPPKLNLTILEYCSFVDDDYDHVYWMLRGELPDYRE